MIKRIFQLVTATLLAATIAKAECPPVQDDIRLNDAQKNLYMECYKLTDKWQPLTAAGEWYVDESTARLAIMGEDDELVGFFDPNPADSLVTRKFIPLVAAINEDGKKACEQGKQRPSRDAYETAVNSRLDGQDIALVELDRAVEYNKGIMMQMERPQDNQEYSKQLLYMIDEMSRLRFALDQGMERFDWVSLRIEDLLTRNRENHERYATPDTIYVQLPPSHSTTEEISQIVERTLASMRIEQNVYVEQVNIYNAEHITVIEKVEEGGTINIDMGR